MMTIINFLREKKKKNFFGNKSILEEKHVRELSYNIARKTWGSENSHNIQRIKL